LETKPYPQREYVQAARDAAAGVKLTPQEIAERNGPKIAEHLQRRRTAAIEDLRASL
jgi:hypothetical protein